MIKPPKKRGPPPAGSRSGPRARAFGERQFGDRRPPGRPLDGAAPFRAERRPPFGDERGLTVQLDADVARVFRTPEAVNEALRLVMRLSRVASGRFASRPGGREGAREGGRMGGREGGDRERRDDVRGPPRGPRGPKFSEE